MKAPAASVLQGVVIKLCPLIEERLEVDRNAVEIDPIYELVCCILSSRVPFELAREATNLMKRHLLLDAESWLASAPSLYEEILEVLLAPLHICGRARRYRFPNLRARQLEQTRQALGKITGGLGTLIDNAIEPLDARRRLVREVVGLGPKQASMFLRNIGRSYDLAVFDSHVLRFGRATGVLSGEIPTSLGHYEKLENEFRRYAKSIGYSVGCVDSAVWITMQAARMR